MPLVSRMRLGTCLAESAIRIASRILFTRSSLNAWFNAIFRKSITLSSPSLLYWGTQRLSETSSKASTENKEESLLALAFVYYSGCTFLWLHQKKYHLPQSCKGKTSILARLFYSILQLPLWVPWNFNSCSGEKSRFKDHIYLSPGQ